MAERTQFAQSTRSSSFFGQFESTTALMSHEAFSVVFDDDPEPSVVEVGKGVEPSGVEDSGTWPETSTIVRQAAIATVKRFI
jgi:hypothetical protein